MTVEGDWLVFGSGRRISANCAVVGLSARSGQNSISEGLDSGLWSDYSEDFEEDPLTKEDLVELANHMIGRWQEFRAHVEGPPGADAR